MNEPGSNPDYFSKDSGGDAKINIALDTLLRLAKLMDNIIKVSTEYVLMTDVKGIILNAGQAQQMKHRFIKMYIARSSKLLPLDIINVFYNELLDMKLKFKTSYNSSGKIKNQYETYDPELDEKMDRLLFRINNELQKKKLFFQTKGESDMF